MTKGQGIPEMGAGAQKVNHRGAWSPWGSWVSRLSWLTLREAKKK